MSLRYNWGLAEVSRQLNYGRLPIRDYTTYVYEHSLCVHSHSTCRQSNNHKLSYSVSHGISIARVPVCSLLFALNDENWWKRKKKLIKLKLKSLNIWRWPTACFIIHFAAAETANCNANVHCECSKYNDKIEENYKKNIKENEKEIKQLISLIKHSSISILISF